MGRSKGAFAAAAALMLMPFARCRQPWLERAAEPRRADHSALSRFTQSPLAFARLGSLWAGGARQCLVPARFGSASACAGFGSQLRVRASSSRRNLASVLIPIALPKPANDLGGAVAVALEAAPIARVRLLPKGTFKAARAKRARLAVLQARAA